MEKKKVTLVIPMYYEEKSCRRMLQKSKRKFRKIRKL